MCLEIDVSAGRMANIMAKSRRFPEVAVNNMTCPSCGSPMKRNGKTKSGSQRWRCVGCGASATHSIDTAARDLAAFVGWLLSKESQVDMPGQGRTFRRRCARFWAIWPMPEAVDEACRVVYVDGIWVASDCVVLIACSDEFVLSWHLARAETAAAWRSLLSRVAVPEMVVTDGGSGFWADFLEQRSVVDGRSVYTHERLRRAWSGLVRLANAGTLFTYLDPALAAEGPLPATNNRIEGGVNAQLRSVLRFHRGLTKLKRVKAVFWWCYLHVEHPRSMADTLREMPTDADIDMLRDRYGIKADGLEKPEKWGEGLVWEELHHKTRYPYSVD